MSGAFDPESIRAALPPYLSDQRAPAFAEALKDLPSARPFYANIKDPDPLQGDLWADVLFLEYPSGTARRTPALLLTNSCDASSDNKRLSPISLTFAMAASFAKYRDMLSAKYGADKIANHLEDVRGQRVTSMLFLPADGQRFDDRIVFLDRTQSLPLQALQSDKDSRRLVSLSDTGFYLLSFKLSIHFCRLKEGIDRTP